MSSEQAFSVVGRRDRAFAVRLRQLRVAAAISQSQLARAAGVPVKTICSLEGGWREPGLQTLLRLARGLGKNLSAFEVPVEATGERRRGK
jgi:transcriptional regulator with XRE-family HTH domain